MDRRSGGFAAGSLRRFGRADRGHLGQPADDGAEVPAYLYFQMLLGGPMIPYGMLPVAVAKISQLLPATQAMNAFNGLAVGKKADFVPWGSILLLLLSGVLAFGQALYLFSWDSRNTARRGHPLLALLALVLYAVGVFLLGQRSEPLHGLLYKIRDLGLPMLSVKQPESEVFKGKRIQHQSMKERKMNKIQIRRLVFILVLGLAGWALCGAIIWIGMAFMSMESTLIVHAIGAPIIFGVISAIYFKAFNYTTPLRTAIVFVSIVIFMDVFVVALLIERSFAMFASLLGTWIPWALIFASTYLTGLYVTRRVETTSVA